MSPLTTVIHSLASPSLGFTYIHTINSPLTLEEPQSHRWPLRLLGFNPAGPLGFIRESSFDERINDESDVTCPLGIQRKQRRKTRRLAVAYCLRGRATFEETVWQRVVDVDRKYKTEKKFEGSVLLPHGTSMATGVACRRAPVQRRAFPVPIKSCSSNTPTAVRAEPRQIIT